jgi:RNA polymerase sigma-70 factor (ECF subfamily)
MNDMGAPPFERLMETHYGEISRYLARMLGRTADADDLAQETFLRAWRASRSLPADANLRAWLFTIATNLARNHFRDTRRRRVAVEARYAAAPALEPGGPDGEAAAQETCRILEAAVAALPLKQRAAFLLRKVHDLDYAAIGRSLACSPDSARAHVFQALKKLRRRLEDGA